MAIRERADARPDCRACGVCCFSELPQYVRVWGQDYERLGEQSATLTQFHGNRCYMAMTAGQCAALRVDRASRRFVCAVYDRRPQACRDIIAGSAACAGERHSKSERVDRRLAHATTSR